MLFSVVDPHCPDIPDQTAVGAEKHGLAVRSKNRFVVVGAIGSQLRQITALGVHDVNIVIALAFQERTVAGEDDFSAIVRPAGINIVEVSAADRKLRLIASVGVADPRYGLYFLPYRL